jgi:ABC-2 type transport system permease protein
LLYNQWRRAGALNAALMVILVVGALATAIPLFIGSFLGGLYLIPKATPLYLLYAWDALVVALVFFWGVGLVAELQRNDPMSLTQFLHLPVSASGVFLINYLSSLLRMSLIVFVPVMLGFSVALLVTKGLSMLLVLPLVAACLLMVTAISYQVQGWLAVLMSNPRRRRNLVVGATLAFILLVQLPNLLNFLAPWGGRHLAELSAPPVEELEKIDHEFEAKEFDANEHARRRAEVMQRHQLEMKRAVQATTDRLEQTARIANLVLPIGWLPLGVMSAAEGSVLPSLLGLAGMTLIGVASLRRAYRTTVGMYQGKYTSLQGRRARAAARPARAGTRSVAFLEARVPGVSEPVSAVALAGLRGLARAPETKMMLLSPLLLLVFFGMTVWRTRQNIPEAMRPLVAIGGLALVPFCLLQILSNQFGFDRDGFRVFILSAASRRDILLGKNLALVPVAGFIAAIMLAIIQFACPLRLGHFLAMLPQFVSMFLLFCVVTNLLSIYAPLYIAPGTLKAKNPKLTTVFLHLVMIAIGLPLAQAVTLLPLGIEIALRLLGASSAIPIYLLLSLVECAAVVLFYYFSLGWQGNLLQSREQMILDAVTNRAP